MDYFFLFEDEGNNWADDTDYTIFVEWLDEPDAAGGGAGSASAPRP